MSIWKFSSYIAPQTIFSASVFLFFFFPKFVNFVIPSLWSLKGQSFVNKTIRTKPSLDVLILICIVVEQAHGHSSISAQRLPWRFLIPLCSLIQFIFTFRSKKFVLNLGFNKKLKIKYKGKNYVRCMIVFRFDENFWIVFYRWVLEYWNLFVKKKFWNLALKQQRKIRSKKKTRKGKKKTTKGRRRKYWLNCP